jgi:uncharacterized protein
VRVILDTNLLVSALLKRGTPPRDLYDCWRQGRFALVSCEPQLLELRVVLERPFFSERIKRSEAGSMINGIRRLAQMYDLSAVPAPNESTDLTVLRDPGDEYLLALAEASRSDYLVTGDKGHLLDLDHHGSTPIVSAPELIALLDPRAT